MSNGYNGRNGNNGKRYMLEGSNGDRTRFRGTYRRKSTKEYGTGVKTRLCFEDLRFAGTGKFIAHHIWVNDGKGFMRAGLTSGDIIEFDARVCKYKRKNGSEDYGLKYPTKIIKVGHDGNPHHRRYPRGNNLLTTVLCGEGLGGIAPDGRQAPFDIDKN
ncbi:MAG: hypothetical protein HPY75_03260 [Actinobacteria bacterium]|nr:hypothetical protein [Actinomycetota bacterium]